MLAFSLAIGRELVEKNFCSMEYSGLCSTVTVQVSRGTETARNGEKRRETARNGEKRRETARNGEKRRETARNGEKRRIGAFPCSGAKLG
jgi:hypothetical protein